MTVYEIKKILKHYPQITGIHPACLAVPEMSTIDRESLFNDVAVEGLREPILLTIDGQLVDGRNRLLACYNGSVEPRFNFQELVDPWKTAISLNIARRHLSVKQRAVFGLALLAHEQQVAKERQGTRTDILVMLPECSGNSRDIVGHRVGVSGRSIAKAAVIAEFAPELMADDSSLETAAKEANKRKREQQSKPVDNPLPTIAGTTTIITARGIQSQIPLPKKVVFNQTTDAVDWASWTWNPVTGCEHGCKFCYAREIANSQRMAAYYPNKFEPTYHEYRLAAPANTKRPDSEDERDGRVFVCSMADLFGKWVPNEWIKAVFNACLNSPEWEYLFLTKWPARYAKMPLIKNAWYGSSVIQQADVKRVESAMQQFADENVVRWISLEPMLGPIRFNDLSWCDLVVIGSQTATTQPDIGRVDEFAPEFDWVVDVVNQCRSADVPYYLKANLGLSRPGMNLPKSKPRGPK